MEQHSQTWLLALPALEASQSRATGSHVPPQVRSVPGGQSSEYLTSTLVSNLIALVKLSRVELC